MSTLALVATPPVTGRVIGSGIVQSPFYIGSGGMDHQGAGTKPVDARHFRKRVETIEYAARDGRVRRATPGDRPAMFPIHLRIWGPVLFGIVFVSIFACAAGLLFGFGGPRPTSG